MIELVLFLLSSLALAVLIWFIWTTPSVGGGQ